MSIVNIKRKKKKKIKKVVGKEVLFTRIFIFFVIIGGIVYGLFGMSEIFDEEGKEIYAVVEELGKPVDENLLLTNNKIKMADKDSLLNKIGPAGADLDIFLAGSISIEVYNESEILPLATSLELYDYECGVFWQEIYSLSPNNYFLTILEVTISVLNDEEYSIYSVCKLDLSSFTSSLKKPLSNIKSIYVSSTSTVEIIGNTLSAKSTTTQINNLNETQNKIALSLFGTIFQTEDGNGITIEIFKVFLKDFCNKTNSIMQIQEGKIIFEV